ncbi:hypothetical protein GCM10017557_62950 [Streptomyces aurantiacus]|uniref:Uncharacterized protein n=2 Tax=Streptomyces aurantiacus TaxID=47760 RepID=A0A7G1PCB9_9ACTN|nr:hypothetical protein GCM10017557_62950 [Streptomyces aurantiacus]
MGNCGGPEPVSGAGRDDPKTIRGNARTSADAGGPAASDTGVGSMTEGLRKMRQTRIEKTRRSVRVRPYQDEERYGDGLLSGLDPRDPDIVRAKRLRPARQGGDGRA